MEEKKTMKRAKINFVQETGHCEHGQSTLGQAILSGNHIYVRELLEKLPPTDVLEKSALGRTFLHTAADMGNFKMVRLLLNQGIDVNTKDSGHWTALHYSSENGNQRISKLLLEYGCNVNERTENMNWTPLHLCASKGHAKLASLLLENGAEVNSLTADKWSPLLLAAHAGHIKTCQYLIKNNADINYYDPTEMETPLHKACRNGHEAIGKLLIEHGAAITLDRMGLTPLAHAIACDFNWQISIQCGKTNEEILDEIVAEESDYDEEEETTAMHPKKIIPLLDKSR